MRKEIMIRAHYEDDPSETFVTNAKYGFIAIHHEQNCILFANGRDVVSLPLDTIDAIYVEEE